MLVELNERNLLPIVRDICRVHGVTLEEVCGTFRSHCVSRARHEVWWRVRNHPDRHYCDSDVARIFGRSPGTITDGIKRHARRLATLSAPKLSND